MRNNRPETAKSAFRALFDLVEDRFPPETAQTVAEFMRNYYIGMPAKDPITTPTADLYKAALGHWNLGNQRDAGDVRIHV